MKYWSTEITHLCMVHCSQCYTETVRSKTYKKQPIMGSFTTPIHFYYYSNSCILFVPPCITAFSYSQIVLNTYIIRHFSCWVMREKITKWIRFVNINCFLYHELRESLIPVILKETSRLCLIEWAKPLVDGCIRAHEYM